MTARVRVAGIAVALCAALGLVGCANRPTTAFVVNGKVTTQRQIDDTAASCAKSYNAYLESTKSTDPPVTAADVRTGVMEFTLGGQIGVALSDRLGVAPSEQDRLQSLKAGGGDYLLMDPGCYAMAMDFATKWLLFTDLDISVTPADVKALNVRLNPRYGTFDVDALFDTTGQRLAINGTGSLSVKDEAH